MGIFRGQGATEYLVLLAVVLIVALVSVALLGFFPGMASDARITQSQSYWRGQARPFAILENICTTGSNATVPGNCTVVLQNVEANGPYNITGMTINGAGTVQSTQGATATFAAGETKLMNVTGLTSCTTMGAGSIYDYAVVITYTTPSGITGAKEYGTKNLIGKCTS